MTEIRPQTREQRRHRREALRFAGMCIAINTVMATGKIGIGLYSGSHALLASALYSINDVLTSIAVGVSLKIGAQAANEGYPYGFGKAEFIAAGIVSQIIALGVFFMFFFSVVDLIQGVPGPPHFVALSLAAASLGVSWWLARRGHALAHKLDSPVLTTHSAHHHADAEGSLLAIIGIAGATMGFHVLDRVIAIIETLHLIALSGKLLGRSVLGLMDSAIPEEDAALVQEAVAEVEGVAGIAHVRSRKAGTDTWVDVAIRVRPELSVAEAKHICDRVEAVVGGVLGDSVVTQIRFQGPRFAYEAPAAGGSEHG